MVRQKSRFFPKQFHDGLYEVHLPVTDLDRSIDFYVGKLGFRVGLGDRNGSSVLLLYEKTRMRWMLGLFRVENIIHRQAAEYHISFRIDPGSVDNIVPFLTNLGIQPIHPPTAPLQGPMNEPIVHGWMPAAAVFFRDPDGHLLEFISDLNDKPRPDFNYRPLSEWRSIVGNGK